MSKRTELDKIIIDKDEQVALKNRAAIDAAGVLALNLIGSPGCGKTTLLERTIAALHDPPDGRAPLRVGVIEGDVQCTFDRDRILAAGAAAIQIETDGACRLDAAAEVPHAANEAVTSRKPVDERPEADALNRARDFYPDPARRGCPRSPSLTMSCACLSVPEDGRARPPSPPPSSRKRGRPSPCCSACGSRRPRGPNRSPRAAAGRSW